MMVYFTKPTSASLYRYTYYLVFQLVSDGLPVRNKFSNPENRKRRSHPSGQGVVIGYATHQGRHNCVGFADDFFFQTLFLSFNFDGLIYCARWNWFGAGSVAFWAAFWWAPRTAGERRLVKSVIFEVLNGCRGFIFSEGHTKIADFNVEHFLRWLILVLEFNWRWAMQIEFDFWIQKLSIKLIHDSFVRFQSKIHWPPVKLWQSLIYIRLGLCWYCLSQYGLCIKTN